MASRKRRDDESQEDYRANLKAEGKAEKEKVHNGKVRKGFVVHNKATPYKKNKHVKEKTTPAHFVFKHLIDVLRTDNGGCETVYYEDFKRCEYAINCLLALGYFKDDPGDIDGSYWMMGAAEESEREAYFDKDKDSHTAISDVLNDIFERIDSSDVGDRES